MFKRVNTIRLGQRIKKWLNPFLGFLLVMTLSSWQGPSVSYAAAPTTRSNTVEFYTGLYDGDGTTGQNSDTDQTFSQMNIELAEAGVDITNAFIIVEIHFEAYNSSQGSYDGWELAFDACVEACAADAFAGSGNVNVDDNNTLAYEENEGNVARFMMDVTAETQLAAYTGGGTDLEVQVGYRVDTGTVSNSIASAVSKLIVTYEYDVATTTTFTNTVLYPLDSTNGTDQGSRTASQSGCTLEYRLGLFDYNVEIPEIGTRLDAWFDISFQRDSGSATDRSLNANIEGTDVSSSTYIIESANGGAVGLDRDVYFSVNNDPTWGGGSGFAENTADQLEIFTSANTFYVLGGIIYETYTASVNSATKTRTVRYPIGIVQASASTAEASKGVDIYLPEGGVDVKSAFYHIRTSLATTGDETVSVATEVGDNAKTGVTAYALNAPSTNTNNVVEIIHIIPSSDYTELESAYQRFAGNRNDLYNEFRYDPYGRNIRRIIYYLYIHR